MIASVSAQDEVVRLLLEHGADISASVQGKTALVGATCSHLQPLAATCRHLPTPAVAPRARHRTVTATVIAVRP